MAKKKYITFSAKGIDAARLLAKKWDAKLIRTKNSLYVYDEDHFILNFGRSKLPEHVHAIDMNHPDAVLSSVRKEITFDVTKHPLFEVGVHIMPYEYSPAGLLKSELVQAQKHHGALVLRKTSIGHDGEGAFLVTGENELNAYLPNSDEDVLTDIVMWTAYVKGAREYRVHVVAGTPSFVLRRAKKIGAEPSAIQTTGNNYVLKYADDELHPFMRQKLQHAAVTAAEALELDVVAVDFLVDPYGDIYLLETNTAFAMGNTTATWVAEQLDKYIEENF